MRGAILALVFAICGTCIAQNNGSRSNPFGGDPRAIELGRVQFRMSCAGCHGLHATGGRSGPDLTRGTFASGDSDADLYRVITTGIDGSEMPAFEGRLEDDQRWRIVAYVQSLATHDAVPIRGDRLAGEKLFWEKGNCGQCHRIGTRGSSLAPNLTRSGRQRSLAYLRESVVAPDTDITRGYATITVVTRDGKKIVGVEKNFDNFSAQLMDASGHLYSFYKDDVASIKREYRSLMPANYSRLFSDKELDDLLAYLASLGGQP